MSEALSEQPLKSFGPFTVHAADRRLERDGVRVEIEPKPFDLLQLLLTHPGKVVTYDEFRARLWPDVVVEVIPNVNTQINKLRKALGEPSSKPHYILTKRGEGYYFNPEIAVTSGIVEAATTSGDVRMPTSTREASEVAMAVAQPSSGLTARRRNAMLAAAAAAVVFVAAASLYLVWTRWQDQDPSRVALTGRVLTMFDQAGEPIHKFSLPGIPPPLPSRDDFGDPQPVLADIDGDGTKELLYAYHEDRNDPDPDIIYCINADGKVRWRHQVGRELHSTGTSRSFPKHYTATWISMLRRPTPAGGRILIGAHRGGTSMFVVEVLTPDAETVGEYYHPGWLWSMDLTDLDGDGNDELILGGVNNAYGNMPGFDHPMTLVVLDSRRIEGQGPAPATDDRHFKGMPEGVERATLFFRDFGQLPTDDPSAFCLFRKIRVTSGHFEAIAMRLSNRAIEATYQFDLHLNLEMVSPSPALVAQLNTGLKRPLSQIDRLNWYAQELGDIKVLKNDFAVKR